VPPGMMYPAAAAMMPQYPILVSSYVLKLAILDE